MSYCDLYLCKTRAVSLDIVPDASCQSFIRSLKRLINQYSVPKLFISDKAKNFVGQELTEYTQSISTNWIYILEATPWWEGFWQRIVQLLKRTLRKILGKQKLNYEELLTFVMEIEGVIN